jgi:hypothetical protein
MSTNREIDGGPDWVRHCRSCGLLDLSARYASPEDAESEGVWILDWQCRECGHKGFDLVEATR